MLGIFGSVPYRPPSRDAVRLRTVRACDRALSEECTVYFFVDDVYENAESPSRTESFTCRGDNYYFGPRKPAAVPLCRQYLNWLLTRGQFGGTYKLTDNDQEYEWALIHDDIQIWEDGFALYFFRTFDPKVRNRFKHIAEGRENPYWAKPYQQYDRTKWYKNETWFRFLQHEHPFCFSELVYFVFHVNEQEGHGFYTQPLPYSEMRTVPFRPIASHDGQYRVYYDEDGLYDQPVRPDFLTRDVIPKHAHYIFPRIFLRFDKDALFRAIKDCSSQFLVAPLTISVINAPEAHANMIIIDKQTGQLIRYEPHGARTSFYNSADLDKLLQELVDKHPEVFPGGYVAPKDFCSTRGFQTKAEYAIQGEFMFGKPSNRDVGWCTVVSLMFLHLRLAYPRLSPKEVENLITSKDSEYLKDAVRSYANFMIMNNYGALPKQE